VAQLKLLGEDRGPDGEQESPRRRRRGPIEAGCASMILPARLSVSTAATPWPN